MDSDLHVPWPHRPDGTNKTMGEMTADERRAQMDAVARRYRARCRQAAEVTS